MQVKNLFIAEIAKAFKELFSNNEHEYEVEMNKHLIFFKLFSEKYAYSNARADGYDQEDGTVMEIRSVT